MDNNSDGDAPVALVQQTRGTLYVCRVYVQKAASRCWHTWHSVIGTRDLMRSTCREYTMRNDVVPVLMFSGELIPFEHGDLWMVQIGGRMLRDSEDRVMQYKGRNAAEVAFEQACLTR